MKKTFEIKLPFKDNILTFKFGKTLIVEIDDERLSSNAKHMKLIREFLKSMFEDSILYLTYVDNHHILLEIYNKLYHSLTDNKRDIKTPQEMEQIFEPVSKKYLLHDSLVFGVADSDVDAAAGAAGQNLGNVDIESEDTFNTDTLPDITDLVQDEDEDVNLREVMGGGYKKTKRKRKPKKTKKNKKVKKTRAKKMSKRSRKGKKKSKKR